LKINEDEQLINGKISKIKKQEAQWKQLGGLATL